VAAVPPTIEEQIASFEKGFGKKVRFVAEAADGRQSAIWSTWANGSDYYLGARWVLKSMKISLHASGRCRIALSDKLIEDMTAKGMPAPADRALVKWNRAATPEVGAICVLSVAFPAARLHMKGQTGSVSKPLLRVGLGPDDQAVQLGIFYTREPREVVDQKFCAVGKPTFVTHLDNGDDVWMVFRAAEYDLAAIPTAEQLAQSTGFSTCPAADFGNVEDLAGLIWEQPTDGQPMHVAEIGKIEDWYSKLVAVGKL
jgi:hypothetical protein